MFCTDCCGAYDQYRVLTRHGWTRPCAISGGSPSMFCSRPTRCVRLPLDPFLEIQIESYRSQIKLLFHQLLYASPNEETSCLKLVHFYDVEIDIPSEMEAYWKSESLSVVLTSDMLAVRTRHSSRRGFPRDCGRSDEFRGFPVRHGVALTLGSFFLRWNLQVLVRERGGLRAVERRFACALTDDYDVNVPVLSRARLSLQPRRF